MAYTVDSKSTGRKVTRVRISPAAPRENIMDSEQEVTSKETFLTSCRSLEKELNTPEEDEAWKDLQDANVFVVRYNKETQKVENVIEDNDGKAFDSYWENADSMYRIKKGPCLAVAIWLDYLYFIQVKAPNVETAAKIAPDILE